MSIELETAVRAANAAGEILMQNFGKKITAKRKSARELVTQVDLQCEKKILSILQADFPSYGIWSEEAGDLDKKSDYRWIVDPLDGTHNFFSGIPIFGVSIGLTKNGVIQCGVILLPVFKELFTAEKGKGAFLNGKPIHVSSRAMADATVNCCQDFLENGEKVEKFKYLRPRILSPRTFGAATFSLASLAAGRIDAIIEFDDKIGDLAAGWLLAEEAGGKFTTLDGRQFSLGNNSYIASSGVFHKELVEIMDGEH